MPFPIRAKPIASALLLVLASGTALAQEGTTHPDARYVDRTEAPTTSVRLTGPAKASRVALESPLAMIGTEDGPEHTIFARIDHSVLVDDSTVAVIEPSLRQVRFFRLDGRYLQTLARRGQGPGELLEPTAIARSARGELLVADASRKILVFVPEAGRYRYSRSIATPAIVRAMCMLGDDLYVSAPTPDDLAAIRRLDATKEGRSVASFGVMYRSPNPLINFQAAPGMLSCDTPRKLIYLQTGGGTGEVRAYRPTGDLVWRVTATDYRTNRVYDMTNGMRMEFGAQGAHGVGGLRLIDPNVLLVQWKYRSREALQARSGEFTLASIEIDLETHAAASIGESLPLILDSRKGLMLAAEHDPVPRLTLHRARVARQP